MADGARPLAITDASRKRRHLPSTNTNSRGAIKAVATPAGLPSLSMGISSPEPAAYYLQRGVFADSAVEMMLLSHEAVRPVVSPAADSPLVGSERRRPRSAISRMQRRPGLRRVRLHRA